MSGFNERVAALVGLYDGGNTTAAAHRAGMPVATLDRIVRGVVTNPRRNALQSIAAAYGVSIDWLLSGGDDAGAVRAARAAVFAEADRKLQRFMASIAAAPPAP